MAHQGKFSGAQIDAQIGRVVDGSVVTDNTLHEITSDDTKPVTGAAVGKGILAMTDSVVKRGSRNPVSGAAVFTAIDGAKAELRGRGYIYMGMADTTTVPDTSQGKVFYLASEKGEYTNFGGAEVTKESLSTLLWDGEAWSAELIADLVTPYEAKQIVLDNTASEVTADEEKPVSGKGIAEAINKAKTELNTKIEEKVDKVEGKGLSTNDYTDEEKEQVAKNKSNIEKKANTTDYYPKMAVGTADNLRGRGEAKEEFFTYRPSAGASNSISEEGVATMKRIKGNSLVWNNLSASIPEMAAHRSHLFDFDGVNTFTVKADKSSSNLALDVTLGKLRPALNHYYLFIVEGSSINDITVYAGSKYPKLSDGWVIVQCTDANGYFYIYPFGLDKDIVAGTTFTIDSVKLVDLTQMFGAGNEPSTIEEFYARIPEGIDINTYNAGELMSMNINTIRTNGLNQWDEKWEVGAIYNGNRFPSSHTIRSVNFMPALPDTDYYLQIGSRVNSIYWGQIIWYDKDFQFIKEAFSNGTTQKSPQNAAYFKIATNTGGGYLYGNTYNNDICINLSHSGVRDGEYEPYEERVHEIPEIAQYFPEGMRSAGGVYDEINESWAIQRVGVRAYEEGDDDDSEVMTDGINTVYPLAEPVVTPLPTRAINLNYPVWDWGTERAVSAKPSAPFRADIVYGFNAVDTIRINKSDIEALFKRVVALEAKVAESEAEATAEPTEV